MAFAQKMSVWFGQKTRTKVLTYDNYPLWLPLVQLPFAILLFLAGLGLTPGARGSGLIAGLGTLWLSRLGWCFYRISKTRLAKRRAGTSPHLGA